MDLSPGSNLEFYILAVLKRICSILVYQKRKKFLNKGKV